MDKLKDCPFCGGKAELTMNEGCDWIIHCDNCDCHMFGDETKEKLISDWNNRDESQLKQYYDELLTGYEDLVKDNSQLEARIKELESELTSVEDTKEIFRRGFNECTKSLDEAEEKLQKAEKEIDQKNKVIEELTLWLKSEVDVCENDLGNYNIEEHKQEERGSIRALNKVLDKLNKEE